MLYTSFYDRPNGTQRKGVVLLIVITMLALFAVVGLSFVFYAESQAVAAMTTAQAQSKTIPDADPELLLSYFLSQLVYGTTNLGSAMRGHDFGTTMYGNNPNGLNYAAYSGIGRLHYNNPALTADDYYFPNRIYYPGDGFLVDPEFYGSRAGPAAPPNAANYRAGNAPYTYPDLNNMFLAQVAADGSVIVPSFRRQWAESTPGITNLNRRYALMFPDAIGYHNGLDNKGNALAISSFNPLGADAGGHVRNLDFSKGFKSVNPVTGAVTYANNDSYWLDLGWPVIIAPNGQKYKALFAPLIIDLDNRINMWLAGNYNGNPSNSGYGPNEINPLVISPTTGQPLISAAEFNQNAANLITMRYGPGAKPLYPTSPAQWPSSDGPQSSRIDFDGKTGGPLTLPDPNNPKYAMPPLFYIWPDYPNGTYGGAPAWYTAATELGFHPLGYNLFLPTPGNNPLPPASNMEAILRHMGTGAPAATSGFFKTMPLTFANARNRGLLTSHSWNLDRIAAGPYINFPAGGSYAYDAAKKYPLLTTPFVSPNFANAAPGGDFSPEYRSTLVNRLRVNLNRLSSFDYPTPVNGLIDMTNKGKQYADAEDARNENGLAGAIYQVLLSVTGTQNPSGAPKPGPETPQFMAARWLAQLAVNIVDYIDNDDISTPFKWYTDPNTNVAEYVFGTEAPRLVINEAFAQFDNDPNDPGLAGNDPKLWVPSTFNLNVWVELHNPFKSTPAGETYPFDSGLARLNVETFNQAAYQIVLSQPDAKLRDPANYKGDPANPLKTARTWWDPKSPWDPNVMFPTTVLPAAGAFNDAAKSNNGFFVAGPAQLDPNAFFTPTVGGIKLDPWPNLPETYPTTDMSVQKIPLAQQAGYTTQTILLRRLACPYRVPQTDPTQPRYNPYITVDYVENVAVQNNMLTIDVVNGTATVADPTKNAAFGRLQPYAAAGLARQTNAPANQPRNTFYSHNAPTSAGGPTLNSKFDWLTHLDRPVINGLELLHVSGFRPHELTQQFVTYNTAVDPPTVLKKFQHYAPWQDPNALIYRSLELLGVPSNLNGTTMGGRIPGKININTMNEVEIWLALCDAVNNPQNNFSTGLTPAQLQNLFTLLIQSRTPGSAPGQSDRPFRPLSTGFVASAPADVQYPGGSGIDDTILRTTASPANLSTAAQGYPPFDNLLLGVGTPNSEHPYRKLELLQKIQNNITTTSNVFAVWLTVGFFEVDDSFTPPKIGSEIGRDQGRQIRHRMFSIVDRTQLTLFNSAVNAGATINGGGAGGTAVILKTAAGNATVMPLTGSTVNGGTWTLQAGMLLEFGSPGKSEVVAVRTDAGGNLVGDFIGSWNAATPVTCRGNPGPWTAYNPRNDPGVVPHFTIIQ